LVIQHDLPLFARDRHFDHMAQLVSVWPKTGAAERRTQRGKPEMDADNGPCGLWPGFSSTNEHAKSDFRTHST
jgi:hypothetical protein